MDTYTDIYWITPYTNKRLVFQNEAEGLFLFHNETHSFLRDGLFHKERACLVGGSKYDVPIVPAKLRGLLKSLRSSKVLSELLYTRFRLRMTSLTGVAREQRSFIDLLSGQFGEVFTAQVYQSYLQRRWGVPGDVLASQLGRLIPGVLEEARPIDLLKDATEEHLLKVAFTDGLEVTTNQGQYRTQKLWVDCPIPKICSLIDGLPKSVQFSLQDVQYLDQSWVEVEGYSDAVVTHIFDDHPMYALIPLQASRAIALLRNDQEVSIEDIQNGLSVLGLTQVGQVQHFCSFQPIWKKGSYTKFLHVLNFLTEKGIYPIANGAFAPVGSSLQQRYLNMVEEGKGTEDVHRHLFDPFVAKMSLRSLRLI